MKSATHHYPSPSPNQTHTTRRYTSSAANDAHLATQPVQDLIKLFTTSDVLASAPEVHISPIVASKTFTPVPTIASNPAILIAHVGYKPDTLSHALRGWKALVENVTKNEYWTKGYTVGEDKEGQSVRTVEMYESWAFFDKVHGKGEAVVKNQEQNGRDRTPVHGAVRVRAIDGYLGRETKSRL